MELPNIDEVRRKTNKVIKDAEQIEARIRLEHEKWLKKAEKVEEERIVTSILKTMSEMILNSSNLGRGYYNLPNSYGRCEGYAMNGAPNPNPNVIAEIVNQKIARFGYKFCYYDDKKMYECSW